jgi:acetyl-CoA carboxylase biotin carboxyl carrier protein
MPKRPSKSAARPAGKPAAKSSAARGSNRLAELQRLIEVMVDKDVVEVEFEEAGTRWRVRRKDAQSVAFAAPAALALPSHAPAAAQPASAHSPAAVPVPEQKGETFKSPMLGTFYRAPSPEAEPFAKPGDKVHADTTLCIIEAMKVMNEIKAERDFEIVDVLVKNGDPVEFGQPLFLIR